MSGGYFDHNQYHITDIADQIERVIQKNKSFNEKTLKEFQKCVKLLKKAEIYVHRIDYLLEGDDGEDTFHARLKEALSAEKT